MPTGSQPDHMVLWCPLAPAAGTKAEPRLAARRSLLAARFSPVAGRRSPVASRQSYRVEMATTRSASRTARAEVRCSSPEDVAPSGLAVDDEKLAVMAKALGHPTRVKIVRLLAARSACVTGDLVAELPLAQSTVSEHLRILREAGLIQGEIEGPRTSYCVNREGLAALQRAVSSL